MQTVSIGPGTRAFNPVTDSVARVPHTIVNSYLVEDPGSGRWVLVDAGLKTSATHILQAARERFGADARPEAIVLTHGHFDHVGALEKLATHWNVPVYAHRLEMPYLTGRASYPPPDPAVGGGLMAVMSRFFTRGPIDLSGRMHALHEDGSVPGLPAWRWIHTPGHSPGHISLHHPDTGVLIVGDAFVTTRQESVTAVLSQRMEVNGPPAYFTPDWPAARESVRLLASLRPEIVATGHGIPMRGEMLHKQLHALAVRFDELAVPRRGRYVQRPAVMGDMGVVYVPPPLPRLWPKYAIAGAGACLLLAALRMLSRQRRTIRGASVRSQFTLVNSPGRNSGVHPVV